MAWLSGWSYRKEITITGQSGAGTNYQVKFNIGDSAGGDFHLEGHCTNFPQDIEVTDNDGTTLLKFWIADLTADPLEMTVKVADDLGSNQTIYIYYGKSGATTNSDIGDTFIDGSEFDDLTGWTQQSGTWSVSSGKLIRDTSSTWVYLRRDSAAPTGNYIIETKYKKSGRAATLWDCDNPMAYTASMSIDDNQGTIMVADDWSVGASDTYSFDSATYYIYSMYRISNAHYAKVLDLDRNILAETGTSIDGSGTGRYFGFAYCTAASSVDWIYIRKYNSPEPAFSSAGSEETPPTGVSPTAVFYGPLIGPLGGPI